MSVFINHQQKSLQNHNQTDLQATPGQNFSEQSHQSINSIRSDLPSDQLYLHLLNRGIINEFGELQSDRLPSLPPLGQCQIDRIRSMLTESIFIRGKNDIFHFYTNLIEILFQLPINTCQVEWVGGLVPWLLGSDYYKTCWELLGCDPHLSSLEKVCDELDRKPIDYDLRIVCMNRSLLLLDKFFQKIVSVFSRKLPPDFHHETVKKSAFTNTVKLITPSDQFSLISFGDRMTKNVDIIFAQFLSRQYLFSHHGLSIPFNQFLETNLPSTPIFPTIHPLSGWQAIISKLCRFIHIDQIETVNQNGWIKWIQLLSKGYCSPKSGIQNILLQKTFPIDSTTCSVSKVCYYLERCWKEEKKCFSKQLNQLFNACLSVSQLISNKDIQQIINCMIPQFEPHDCSLYSSLFCVLKNDAISFTCLKSLLQMACSIRWLILPEKQDGKGIYIKSHEGAPAYQLSIEDEFSTNFITLQIGNLDQLIQTVKNEAHHWDAITLLEIEILLSEILPKKFTEKTADDYLLPLPPYLNHDDSKIAYPLIHSNNQIKKTLGYFYYLCHPHANFHQQIDPIFLHFYSTVTSCTAPNLRITIIAFTHSILKVHFNNLSINFSKFIDKWINSPQQIDNKEDFFLDWISACYSSISSSDIINTMVRQHTENFTSNTCKKILQNFIPDSPTLYSQVLYFYLSNNNLLENDRFEPFIILAECSLVKRQDISESLLTSLFQLAKLILATPSFPPTKINQKFVNCLYVLFVKLLKNNRIEEAQYLFFHDFMKRDQVNLIKKGQQLLNLCQSALHHPDFGPESALSYLERGRSNAIVIHNNTQERNLILQCCQGLMHSSNDWIREYASNYIENLISHYPQIKHSQQIGALCSQILHQLLIQKKYDNFLEKLDKMDCFLTFHADLTFFYLKAIDTSLKLSNLTKAISYLKKLSDKPVKLNFFATYHRLITELINQSFSATHPQNINGIASFLLSNHCINAYQNHSAKRVNFLVMLLGYVQRNYASMHPILKQLMYELLKITSKTPIIQLNQQKYYTLIHDCIAKLHDQNKKMSPKLYQKLKKIKPLILDALDQQVDSQKIVQHLLFHKHHTFQIHLTDKEAEICMRAGKSILNKKDSTQEVITSLHHFFSSILFSHPQINKNSIVQLINKLLQKNLYAFSHFWILELLKNGQLEYKIYQSWLLKLLECDQLTLAKEQFSLASNQNKFSHTEMAEIWILLMSHSLPLDLETATDLYLLYHASYSAVTSESQLKSNAIQIINGWINQNPLGRSLDRIVEMLNISSLETEINWERLLSIVSLHHQDTSCEIIVKYFQNLILKPECYHFAQKDSCWIHYLNCLDFDTSLDTLLQFKKIINPLFGNNIPEQIKQNSYQRLIENILNKDEVQPKLIYQVMETLNATNLKDQKIKFELYSKLFNVCIKKTDGSTLELLCDLMQSVFQKDIEKNLLASLLQQFLTYVEKQTANNASDHIENLHCNFDRVITKIKQLSNQCLPLFSSDIFFVELIGSLIKISPELYEDALIWMNEGLHYLVNQPEIQKDSTKKIFNLSLKFFLCIAQNGSEKSLDAALECLSHSIFFEIYPIQIHSNILGKLLCSKVKNSLKEKLPSKVDECLVSFIQYPMIKKDLAVLTNSLDFCSKAIFELEISLEHFYAIFASLTYVFSQLFIDETKPTPEIQELNAFKLGNVCDLIVDFNKCSFTFFHIMIQNMINCKNKNESISGFLFNTATSLCEKNFHLFPKNKKVFKQHIDCLIFHSFSCDSKVMVPHSRRCLKLIDHAIENHILDKDADETHQYYLYLNEQFPLSDFPSKDKEYEFKASTLSGLLQKAVVKNRIEILPRLISLLSNFQHYLWLKNPKILYYNYYNICHMIKSSELIKSKKLFIYAETLENSIYSFYTSSGLNTLSTTFEKINHQSYFSISQIAHKIGSLYIAHLQDSLKHREFDLFTYSRIITFFIASVSYGLFNHNFIQFYSLVEQFIDILSKYPKLWEDFENKFGDLYQLIALSVIKIEDKSKPNSYFSITLSNEEKKERVLLMSHFIRILANMKGKRFAHSFFKKVLTKTPIFIGFGKEKKALQSLLRFN